MPLLIELVQKRIANISVGASTVRGQPKGTKGIAIDYLQSVNLKDFSDVTGEAHFKNLLDKRTNELKDKLPSSPRGRWGIARKVLNIFLFQAVHDILLNRNYTFDKIITYLEVPLDNKNAKKLKKFAKERGINLDWKNIHSLDPETNMRFQEYAKQCARLPEYDCERCYLDVYWWRERSKDAK